MSVFDTRHDKNLRRGSVQHRRQMDEAPAHGGIGDVHGPSLVGVVDDQIAQQLGRGRMGRMAAAGVGAPVQRLAVSLLHQPAPTGKRLLQGAAHRYGA